MAANLQKTGNEPVVTDLSRPAADPLLENGPAGGCHRRGTGAPAFKAFVERDMAFWQTIARERSISE